MKTSSSQTIDPVASLSLFLPSGILDYFTLVNHVSQDTCFILYLEDIVHVGIDNHLKHHLRMIRTTPVVLYSFFEGIKIEIINDSVDYADRIVRRNIFHQFFEEKELFGWECKDENVTLP